MILTHTAPGRHRTLLRAAGLNRGTGTGFVKESCKTPPRVTRNRNYITNLSIQKQQNTVPGHKRKRSVPDRIPGREENR